MRQPWFTRARFGIFIHWGIYSHDRWSDSWPLFNGEVGFNEYMAGAKEFTADAYRPDEWAKLFAQSGADYTTNSGISDESSGFLKLFRSPVC